MPKASSLQKDVESAFNELSRWDFPLELPYLLLTSTSESMLRDVLASKLRTALRQDDYVIAREYHRVDYSGVG